MRIIEAHNRRAVNALVDRRPARDPLIHRRAARIIERVRHSGDEALLAFARRFDGLDGPIEVSRAEMTAGAAALDPQGRSALRLAARHIAGVARRQIPRTWT